MDEFIKKLIERLEEESDYEPIDYDCGDVPCTDEQYFIATDKAISIVNELAEEYKGNLSENLTGWIACSERLPEDGDNRFYMCIVENHEEDLPMFCQYDEDYGFGFWHDIYDEHTLGFVDSEFKTNEELGYEAVIAWQPLPAPYIPDEKMDSTTEAWKQQTMSRFERVE